MVWDLATIRVRLKYVAPSGTMRRGFQYCGPRHAAASKSSSRHTACADDAVKSTIRSSNASASPARFPARGYGTRHVWKRPSQSSSRNPRRGQQGPARPYGTRMQGHAVGRNDDELLMEVKNLLENLSRALLATERILNTIREEPHANGKKASEDTDPAKRSEEDGRPGGVVPPMT